MARFMIDEETALRAEAALRRSGDVDDQRAADALEVKRRMAALSKSLADMDRDGVPERERPPRMRRTHP